MSLGLVSGVGEGWAAVEIACCWEMLGDIACWKIIVGKFKCEKMG